MVWGHEFRPDLFPLPGTMTPKLPSRRWSGWTHSDSRAHSRARAHRLGRSESIADHDDDIEADADAFDDAQIDDAVPENVSLSAAFREYFGSFHEVHSGSALRWMDSAVAPTSPRSRGGTNVGTRLGHFGGYWVKVFLLAFGGIVRIYESAENEPDDPLALLYSTNSNGTAAEVTICQAHGRIHCFEVSEPNCISACFAVRTHFEALRWAVIINPKQWSGFVKGDGENISNN